MIKPTRKSQGFSSKAEIQTPTKNSKSLILQDAQAKQADSYIAKGRLKEAEEICLALIKASTKNHSIYANLAVIRGIQGRHHEARDLIKQAIILDPLKPESYYNLGITYEKLGDPKSAIKAYKQSLELDPDDAETHINLGNAFAENDNADHAVLHYKLAVNLKPKNPEAYINLGNMQTKQGAIHDAIKTYKEAISIDPQNPEPHWNYSLTLLLSGNFQAGWEEYEWRTKRDNEIYKVHADPKCNRWDGNTLTSCTNKQLLLVAEQGLGDTLQFMRYMTAFKDQGINASICAHPKLHPLIKASGISNSPLSPIEGSRVTEGSWLPLLSAPKHLGVNPKNPVIDAPYIKASKELLEKWKSILSIESKPIIGINWQGNPNSEKTGLKGRSLPLKAFSKIASKKDISLLSLQKGFGSEQLEKCSFKESFVESQCLINETWDFLETAAIISNCDLIITSDTAVAHLAGGLGKPTWLLLHKVPDWRWGLEGDTTFWYPSMRLFRQRKHGDWNEVMRRVNDCLKTYF